MYGTGGNGISSSRVSALRAAWALPLALLFPCAMSPHGLGRPSGWYERRNIGAGFAGGPFGSTTALAGGPIAAVTGFEGGALLTGARFSGGPSFPILGALLGAGGGGGGCLPLDEDEDFGALDVGPDFVIRSRCLCITPAHLFECEFGALFHLVHPLTHWDEAEQLLQQYHLPLKK